MKITPPFGDLVMHVGKAVPDGHEPLLFAGPGLCEG
jgi:hypothetical protein